MFGIDQRQNGVQQVLLGDFFVHKEGLRHRAGVGQAGGLNHHTFKIQLTFASFGRQHLQGLAQVFTNGAADATIVHLDDGLLGVVDQNLVVDVFFTKLVFNHSDFLPVRFGQDAL